MEDTHSEKRGFFFLFALYQSAVSPGEKTIQTDLRKKGILPYAPAPCVTLTEGLLLVLLIDVDVVTPL